MNDHSNAHISRRRFLAKAGLGGGGLLILPEHLRFRDNEAATALIHHAMPA